MWRDGATEVVPCKVSAGVKISIRNSERKVREEEEEERTSLEGKGVWRNLAGESQRVIEPLGVCFEFQLTVRYWRENIQV